MKLHLPKLLLTAVLAACVTTAAKAATGWNGTTLYIGDPNNQTGVNRDGITNLGSYTEEGKRTVTFEKVDASIKGAGVTIWADGTDGEAIRSEISTMVVSDVSQITVSKSSWGPRYFEALTIETLEVKNNGGVSLNIGYNGDSYTNTVNIQQIKGSVSSVNVSSGGSLTLGTAGETTTFSGTMTNTGSLTVNGAIAVSNLSNFAIAKEGTETWSDTSNSQGFKIVAGATYILSTGNVTYDSSTTAVNDNGETRALTFTDDGKATFVGGNVTGTTYYLINADVTAGAAGTEGAKAYDVANGRTLYIVDGSADNATLNLKEGSTINISNASRTFTASNRAHNVIIGDKGIVTISGEDWGAAYIHDTVEVLAGGKLVLDRKDSMGWSGDCIKTIDITGEEGKIATVEMKGKQTMKTNINLLGYASMTNAGDGALEFFGGSITASGTNNTIEGNLMARNAGTIKVEPDGELRITGNLTCNTEENANPGTITKTGAGTLIFEGTNNAYGLIAVEAGSLVLANGLTTANSGGLTIAEGASLTTGATIFHNGSGSVTLNGSITIDTTDLKKFEIASAGGNVSYSDGADGFMTTAGASYYLVKGSSASGSTTTTSNGYTLTYDDNGVTFVDSSSNTSEEYFVNTANAQSAEGTFKYKLNSAEAVLNVNGTLSNSRIIMGEGKVAVSAGNTLAIDTAANNAKELLLTTTGDGNVTLATSVTLGDGDETKATGKLSISEGATLTMGNSDSHTASISSFNTVELDGGKIYFRNKQDTFHNLTVTAKNGTFELFDMGQVEDNAKITMAGTTTLNGNLTYINTWNSQIDIEKVSGTGKLILNGKDRYTNNTSTISINGVDNFTGSVHITNMATSMKLNVVENLGLNVYVDSYTADNVKNGFDFTGIGAGNTITLQGARGYLAKDSTIAANLIIKNSSDGSKAGLELNDGSSNSTNTFTGTVSGSGNMVINCSLSNFKQKFTGDISGWTGRLDIASGTHSITFTGNSSVVKTQDILVRGGSTADIVFDHTKAATVTAPIIINNNSTLNLVVKNTAAEGTTFSGSVQATTATIKADTVAKFTNAEVQMTNLLVETGAQLAFTAKDALNVSNLSVANVGTITVANGDAAGSLSASGAVTLAGGATINAAVVDLRGASSVSFDVASRAIALNGALTMSSTEAFVAALGNSLAGLTAGEMLTVFTGVSSFTVGDVTYSAESENQLAGVDLSTWSNDVAVGQYTMTYNTSANVGSIVITAGAMIPEPASATLSLAALMMLCARRRRRK